MTRIHSVLLVQQAGSTHREVKTLYRSRRAETTSAASSPAPPPLVDTLHPIGTLPGGREEHNVKPAQLNNRHKGIAPPGVENVEQPQPSAPRRRGHLCGQAH